MSSGTKFCPDHPDLKVRPFQNECTICNKPLQYRPTTSTKPAPPVVEDLENTVYDRRIDKPKEKDQRTKTEILRDQWDVEEEKETVLKRLAEMEKPEPEKVGIGDPIKKPIPVHKIEPEPEKVSFKALKEKVAAKVKEKLEAKHVVSRVKSHGELALPHKKGKQ